MRLVGFLVTVIVAIAIALYVMVASHTHTQKFVSTQERPVSKIVVRSDGGDVRIVRRTAQVQSRHVEVHATQHWSRTRPTRDVRLGDDGTLHLTSRCFHGWLHLTCSTNWTIYVPRAVAVDVRTDAGDVHVEGTTGDVLVRTDSGDVVAQDVIGAVDLDTDSGNVVVTAESTKVRAHSDSGKVSGSITRSGGHLTGTTRVDAQSDSGDVDLTVDAPISTVKLRSDSGDIDLQVPPGGYATKLHSDSGSHHLRGGVRNDASAHGHIDASTDSGDVVVRGLAR